MSYSGIITSIPCMECLPESNRHLLDEYRVLGDWEISNDQTVLSCTNCGFERPYVKRPPVTDSDGLTAPQQKALAYIKDNLIALTCGEGHVSDNEFKEFEIISTDCGYGRIMLRTVIGSVGDEGTMAAVFARDKRALLIGPRGGLELTNPAKFIKNKDGSVQKTFKDGYIKGDRALKHPSY